MIERRGLSERLPHLTRSALLIAAAIMALSVGLSAQPAPQVPDAPAAQSASTDRVGVPEPTAQALAYHRSGTVLWVLNTLWALVLPAALLWTGLSARMRN